MSEDKQVETMGAALYCLLGLIDEGWEYPDAEHKAARKFGVNQRHLRSAYDEFTSVPHNPADYL